MINVKELTKTYGKQRQILAVDGISFSIEKGEIFGLIGPDGAGKTSVFRMLATLLLPDSGSATINGFDMVKAYRNIRNIIGYMPGKFSLYQDLTIAENLHFFATVFNTTVEENYALIEDIYKQIAPFKNRKAGDLSGGMKQKLALCCALIHKPVVLFLDEPTTGVDPVSRKEFWQMLQRLKKGGITIIVATPYMDEAGLCDRIALMNKGKLLAVDPPGDIASAFPHELLAVKAGKMSVLLKVLKANENILDNYAFGEYAHVVLKTKDTHQEDTLRQYLEQQEIMPQEIKPVTATIEDCFISMLK